MKKILRSKSNTFRQINGAEALRINAPANSPRNIARSSKIHAMTRQQIRELRRWLLVEKLTYAQARVRLRERFGLDLGSTTLCNFWYQRCLRIAPPPRERKPAVFLDVVIQSIKPVRVRVLETRSRLRFKVGTQRQLALFKKQILTINPPGADKPNP